MGFLRKRKQRLTVKLLSSLSVVNIIHSLQMDCLFNLDALNLPYLCSQLSRCNHFQFTHIIIYWQLMLIVAELFLFLLSAVVKSTAKKKQTTAVFLLYIKKRVMNYMHYLIFYHLIYSRPLETKTLS